MKILGIETSCDETAAAVVENGTKIITNVVASSAEMHAKTGGVIPEMAARQQIKSIIPVINEALSEVDKNDIDAIAVTVGPGLIGSLLVGVETAKTLARVWNKPIIPVNHLIAHLYANWFEGVPEFPALGLVVSGGHTDLVLLAGHGKLKHIGATRDDAAGEAFDKTARLLGLPYPGGPSIAKAAAEYKLLRPERTSSAYPDGLNLFPRPLSDEDNFDWSFSGLKTAAAREVQRLKAKKKLNKETVGRIAAEVQEAIADCLVLKSKKAIDRFRPKSFLLAGGVAANKRLRDKFMGEVFSKTAQVQFHVPEAKLCTDNAAYIASCAYFNYKPVDRKSLEANPELTISSKL